MLFLNLLYLIILDNQIINPTSKIIKNFIDYTDHELILLWQNGDDSAFEHLYLKYSVKLLTIAVQKTNQREISKELVQHIFITLFKNKQTAHQITSLMAYLYTILKNRILDQHKHDLIHKKYEDYSSYQNTHSFANNVDAYIETKELEQQLNEEIKKLPPQCQHIFKLRREHNLTNNQVAVQLNISEKTVEQHMTKALKILKAAFHIGQKIILIIYMCK